MLFVLSLHLHLCMCVCVCVCVCMCIGSQSRHVKLLRMKIDSHYSSLPNCVNRDLVTWEVTQLLHQLTAEVNSQSGVLNHIPSCLHNIPHNCTVFAQLST